MGFLGGSVSPSNTVGDGTGTDTKLLSDSAGRAIVMDGNTGSAKTEVLKALPERGVQVLDLEGLAHHRGSLFGALGPQPSQKAFDCALAMAISRLDPTRPVVIEAESSKVGNCRLPPWLWKAMTQAPRLAIAAPVAARASYLTRAYADMTADPLRLATVINRLRPGHPAERIETWLALAAVGDFVTLAAELMQHHYDPRYGKHRDRMEVGFTELATDGLAPEDLARLADQVAATVLATA